MCCLPLLVDLFSDRQARDRRQSQQQTQSHPPPQMIAGSPCCIIFLCGGVQLFFSVHHWI